MTHLSPVKNYLRLYQRELLITGFVASIFVALVGTTAVGRASVVGITTAIAAVGATSFSIRRTASFVTTSFAVRGTSSFAVRCSDFNGLSVNDVFDLLVTNSLIIVAGVSGVEFALSVVPITAFLLAEIGVVIIVLHTPIEVVVWCVLKNHT